MKSNGNQREKANHTHERKGPSSAAFAPFPDSDGGAILGSKFAECAILDRIAVFLRHIIEERKGSSYQKRLGSFSDFRTLVGTFRR
jgi:hypothetical protein